MPLPRAAILAAAALYVAAVAAIALWPGQLTDSPPTGRWVFQWLGVWEWPEPSLTFTLVELGANVLLFVPFGVLGALLLPHARWWHVALAGLALSGLIELTQHLLLPLRDARLADVAANGSGALLGVLVTSSLTPLRRARRNSRLCGDGGE
jgi:hypothetical protein